MASSVSLPSQDQVARKRWMIAGFEILEKVGQGAMGTVYKARQGHLDRVVALKILPSHVASDRVFIERFQREARASAKLNHPNIVAGYDVGQDPDSGRWYFAMEFVNGPSLATILREVITIPEARAIQIAKAIARALNCAFQNGIVHRDIKPDNILMTRDGEAKLADLGLVHNLQDADARLTSSGLALGTPHYMAPEQAAGEHHKIDSRTDIYALGATLYHLVTGRTPFTGKTASVIMTKHLMERPVPVNEVNPLLSAPFAALIDKMMQKERALRFANPKELLKALDVVEAHAKARREAESAGSLLQPPPGTAEVAAPPSAPLAASRPIPAPRAARRRVRRARSLSATRRRATAAFGERPLSALPFKGERAVGMAAASPAVALPAPAREVRRLEGENAPRGPSLVRGLVLDLTVVFVLLLVLAGGYLLLQRQNRLAWVRTPPTQSVSSPSGPAEPAAGGSVKGPDAPARPLPAAGKEAPRKSAPQGPGVRKDEPPVTADRKPVIILPEQTEAPYELPAGRGASQARPPASRNP